MPQFNATREEITLIGQIAKRAENALGRYAPQRLQVVMDLEACHSNGCPLDLEAMAYGSRTEDVVHDVCGIARHIDRNTGKLGDCFVPRHAAREA